MKQLTLGELFTTEQLHAAEKIFSEESICTKRVDRIEKEIVQPAMQRINEITLQANNARYFAYALEHAMANRLIGR